VDKTARTITFGWTAQPGADGFRFLRDGTIVARTLNRSTRTATFWKGSRYAVQVMHRAGKLMVPLRKARAFVPSAAGGDKAVDGRLVFVPAPRINFRLRLVGKTKHTVTFAWKKQPQADGFRFLRNGVVVATTFKRSTTQTTFWKAARYRVEVLRKTGSSAVPIASALAYTPGAKKITGGGGKPSASNDRAGGSGSSAADTAKPSDGKSQSNPPSQPAKPTTPAPSKPAPTPPAPPAQTPPSTVVGPGGVLTLSGTYSPREFFSAIAAAPPGPVTVRGGFSVSGSVTINQPSVTIEHASVSGIVTFGPDASGSGISSSSALGFAIKGADNVRIENNVFDGRGVQKDGGVIWDEPAGNAPSGWVVRNNVMKNFYTSDSSDHSQALYIGYSTDGLIEGNTFTKNGNTAHIFFTWFGNEANPSTSYPRRICVRGNTFNETAGAYIDVNFRAEIPRGAQIVVQANASSDRPEFRGSC
jgi:hypothetical protein